MGLRELKTVLENGGSKHYKHPDKIEVAEIIVMYDLNFFEGNVLKYLLRKKETKNFKDLIKARNYLEMELANSHDVAFEPSEISDHHKFDDTSK